VQRIVMNWNRWRH